MSRFSPLRIVLFAAAGLLSSAGAARATCPIETAGYQGGAYGAYAVTTTACFTDIDENGGTGFTTAAASSVGLSSSATLASGVLTADSQSGFASSSIWDSFTYTGLPAGGTTITATLSVPGTLTGSSDGMAALEEGTQTEGLTLVDTVFFNNATGQPEPLSLSFDVTNGAPVIVFAEIQVDGLNGVADLGDPPTLSLNLPEGASVTTASGVFDSFVTATVPEPSTWAMMLLGFAGLGYAAYRRTRNAVSVGRIPTPLKRARPTGQITRYLNRTYRVLATRTGTRGRGALPAPARHANRPRTLRRDLKRLAVGPREVAEVDRAALEMRSTCKRTGVRIPPSPPRILA